MLLLAAAGTAAAEPPPKVDRLPIVDRAIEHHGGATYEASVTELRLCSKSGCFDLSVSRRGGEFDYLVEGDVRGGRRQVRATNDEVRLVEDGRVVEIDGEEATRLRDWVSEKVYFPFLPYRLNDASAYKQDLGLETWGGEPLHKVKVTFAAGSSTDAADEYLYWFEPETGRLVQFAYSFAGDPGGIRFRRARNYRRIGGLLFFDQENLGLGGDQWTVDRITPDLVATMPTVSTVRLEGIRVEPAP